MGTIQKYWGNTERVLWEHKGILGNMGKILGTSGEFRGTRERHRKEKGIHCILKVYTNGTTFWEGCGGLDNMREPFQAESSFRDQKKC